MPIRILRRKFNGGPLDGEERLLNAEICDYREIALNHTQGVGGGYHVDERGDLQPDEPNEYKDHVYKLGSDAEFHYKGVL